MAGRAVIAIAFDLAKRDVDTECAEVMQSFDAGPCRLADQALGDRCAIDNVAWRRRQCGPGEGEDEQTTEESGGLAHRGGVVYAERYTQFRQAWLQIVAAGLPRIVSMNCRHMPAVP
ncbi:hypothetical protein D560_1060 [Bordetella holmesii ATCC 51541]|nr:hypothetical protein D560_1060 [Bordetella holmesii ATCC 51541]